MDEIKKHLSEMDLLTMILLLLGTVIYFIGRYYYSYFTSNKRIIYLIKVIPLLIGLPILILGFINKIHHETLEGCLLTAIIFFSIISLFSKIKV